MKNDYELEKLVSHVLLTRWKEHDLLVRKEAGIDSHEGIDYHKNAESVKWARAHAQELIQIANEMLKNKTDANTALSERIKKMEKRRKNK